MHGQSQGSRRLSLALSQKDPEAEQEEQADGSGREDSEGSGKSKVLSQKQKPLQQSQSAVDASVKPADNDVGATSKVEPMQQPPMPELETIKFNATVKADGSVIFRKDDSLFEQLKDTLIVSQTAASGHHSLLPPP